MTEKSNGCCNDKSGYVASQFYYGEDTLIPVASTYNKYPVTPEQQQLYILQKMVDHEVRYNVSKVFFIKGEIDKAKLAAAFDQLVERHAILRTYFIAVDGRGYQKVARKVHYKKLFKTIANKVDIPYVIYDWLKPFQTDKPGLFSFGLIEVSKTENYVFLAGHYSILDNRSLMILFDELMKLYCGKSLDKPVITYHDFAVWQERRFYERDYEKCRRFWHEMLKGDLPLLNMPTDYMRPAIMDRSGSEASLDLSMELSEKIRGFVCETKTSLCALFFSAYSGLLSQLSQQEDIIIGIPFAGRMYKDVINIPGMFANMHGIRTNPDKKITFIDFLEKNYLLLEEAKLNQSYPITTLLEELKVQQRADRNPLCDVSFEFLPDSGAKMHGALETIPFLIPVRTSWFDLSFTVQDLGSHLTIGFIYYNKLFKQSTIKNWLKAFERYISVIIDEPSQALADLGRKVEFENKVDKGQVDLNENSYSKDAATWLTMVKERAHLQKIKLRLTKSPKLDSSKKTAQAKKNDCSVPKELSKNEENDYKAVLLIGADEYVGVHIFYELFCQSKCELYLLVVAEKEEMAKAKIKGILDYYLGESLATLCLGSPRVHIIVGDICKTNLGVSRADAQLLAQNIDMVLNSVQAIPLDNDKDLYVENVQAVLNLIEFAKKIENLVDVVYLSTLSIASGDVKDKLLVHFNEFDSDIGQKMGFYYAKTKLQAEKELEKARAEGLSVTIYRIGDLLLPAPKGKLPQNLSETSFFNLFSAYVNIGIVPRDFVNPKVSRVDDVARAIVAIQNRKGKKEYTFHVHSEQVINLGHVLNSAPIHMEIQEASNIEFVNLLYKNFGRLGFKEYIENIIARSDWISEKEVTQYHIDSEKTMKYLEQLNFKWHEVDLDVFDALVEVALTKRIQFLSKLPVVQDFNSAELFSLAKKGKQVLYAPAEVIAWEGDFNDKFIIIWDGFVDSSKRNVIGWENSIGIYKNGDFFGSASLADGVTISQTTLEAMNQDVLILEFKAEAIRDFMKAKPEFALRLIQNLHEQLDRLKWLWINAN